MSRIHETQTLHLRSGEAVQSIVGLDLESQEDQIEFVDAVQHLIARANAHEVYTGNIGPGTAYAVVKYRLDLNEG